MGRSATGFIFTARDMLLALGNSIRSNKAIDDFRRENRDRAKSKLSKGESV